MTSKNVDSDFPKWAYKRNREPRKLMATGPGECRLCHWDIQRGDPVKMMSGLRDLAHWDCQALREAVRKGELPDRGAQPRSLDDRFPKWAYKRYQQPRKLMATGPGECEQCLWDIALGDPVRMVAGLLFIAHWDCSAHHDGCPWGTTAGSCRKEEIQDALRNTDRH